MLLLNDSSSEPLTGKTEKALYTSILVVITLFGATTNLCAVRIIWINTKLHRLCYYVFVNLCVTHMILIVTNIPVVIIRVYTGYATVDNPLCQLQAFALNVCMAGCVSGITVLCGIRWLAVTKPYHYRNRLGKKWLMFLILGFVWVLAIACCFPPFVGWGKYKYYPSRYLCLNDFSPIDANRISYLVFFGLCAFLLPISLSLYFQFSSLNIARLQCKKDKTRFIASRPKRKTFRALTASLCILGVYLVLWLPQGLLVFVWDLHGLQAPRDLQAISMVVAMCSSFTTPLCFTITDRLLRNRMIQFVRSIFLVLNKPARV